MKKNNNYYKELRKKNKEQKAPVQNTEVDPDKEVIAGRNAILEAIKSGREIPRRYRKRAFKIYLCYC